MSNRGKEADASGTLFVMCIVIHVQGPALLWGRRCGPLNIAILVLVGCGLLRLLADCVILRRGLPAEEDQHIVCLAVITNG